MAFLDVSVSGFEPELALYGGSDGLNFYRSITVNYAKILKPGGYLVFEVGYEQAADVRAIMEQNGFTDIDLKEIASEDVPEGYVVKTDPQRTQVVPEGQKITVYISTGKPIEKVEVDDMVGMSQDAAKKKIENNGLVCKIEKTYLAKGDKFYPVGNVVKQDPTKSEVDEGTTVTIYVCAGYKFDIEVDLPIDFVTDSYYLSLWSDGKMIKQGDKVSPADKATYTFKDITVEDSNAEITVKISKDKSNEQNLYDISLDAKKDGYDRVTVNESYYDYDKKSDSEPDNNENTDGEGTDGEGTDGEGTDNQF